MCLEYTWVYNWGFIALIWWHTSSTYCSCVRYREMVDQSVTLQKSDKGELLQGKLIYWCTYKRFFYQPRTSTDKCSKWRICLFRWTTLQFFTDPASWQKSCENRSVTLDANSFIFQTPNIQKTRQSKLYDFRL